MIEVLAVDKVVRIGTNSLLNEAFTLEVEGFGDGVDPDILATFIDYNELEVPVVNAEQRRIYVNLCGISIFSSAVVKSANVACRFKIVDGNTPVQDVGLGSVR